MGMTFREFAQGGELTVYPSAAGAPDLGAFMAAADAGNKPAISAAPPPKLNGPGM